MGTARRRQDREGRQRRECREKATGSGGTAETGVPVAAEEHRVLPGKPVLPGLPGVRVLPGER